MIYSLANFVGNSYSKDATGVGGSIEVLYQEVSLKNLSSTLTSLMVALIVVGFSYSILYVITWYIEKKELLCGFRCFKLATFGLGDASKMEAKDIFTWVCMVNSIGILALVGVLGRVIVLILESIIGRFL